MRDDRVLISEVQEGSIAAIKELYDRYCTRAWRVALSVCGDERRAEDAVEEAFVSMWRNSGAYRPEHGSVAAWLLTAVRNQAVATIRRDQADGNSRAAELPGSPRVSAQIGAEAEALDQVRALRVLLEGLPESQQEVITLALYGELTHDEIATCLGLSPDIVKGRMRLGLHKLTARKEQVAS